METNSESFENNLDTSKNYTLASAGKRFLNIIIDTILIYICTYFAYQIVPKSITENNSYILNFLTVSEISSWVLLFIVLFIYYFAFEAFFQRTPAKFITGTTVILRHGAKPNAETIVLRTLCRLIPFDAFSFLGTHKNERTWWHDRLTETRVIEGIAKNFASNMPSTRVNASHTTTTSVTNKDSAIQKEKKDGKYNLFPQITSLESARGIAKQGVWAAGLQAGFTLLLMLLSLLDSFAWIDIILFSIVAFGIYKMSRFAAFSGLILFLLERFIQMFSPSFNFRLGFLLSLIVFLVWFINGIRGTMTYHILKDFVTEQEINDIICPHCGEKTSSKVAYCINCKKEI